MQSTNVYSSCISINVGNFLHCVMSCTSCHPFNWIGRVLLYLKYFLRSYSGCESPKSFCWIVAMWLFDCVMRYCSIWYKSVFTEVHVLKSNFPSLQDSIKQHWRHSKWMSLGKNKTQKVVWGKSQCSRSALSQLIGSRIFLLSSKRLTLDMLQEHTPSLSITFKGCGSLVRILVTSKQMIALYCTAFLLSTTTRKIDTCYPLVFHIYYEPMGWLWSRLWHFTTIRQVLLGGNVMSSLSVGSPGFSALHLIIS